MGVNTRAEHREGGLVMTGRRELLLAGLIGTAMAPSGAVAANTQPVWLRRMFHLYTDASGESKIRELPLPKPSADKAQYLLRRAAERVTLGSMPPDYLMDFHVANQPNLLIPIFGSLVVVLKDGSRWTFEHGDALFAEDCTGGGHRSGAGPEGCFSISVQVPKTAHCLDGARTVADVFFKESAAP